MPSRTAASHQGPGGERPVINGRRLVGNQPFEAFQAPIKEAIREADALVQQRHVPAEQVYDELMKSARADLSAAR